MREPSEDVTKLPKWAQSRIQRLERDNRYLQNMLSEIKSDKWTPIEVELTHRISTYFPVDTRVVFRVISGEIRLKIDEKGESVEIMKYGGGGMDSIIINPCSSNVIRLS